MTFAGSYHGNAIATKGLMDARLPSDAFSSAADEGRSGGVELEIVDPCADGQWDREALSHPDSTVFHSSAWARVLVKTYAHEPRYCRFTRAGELVALVPLMGLRSLLSGNRGVSLPFTDFCEPLLFAEAGPAFITEKLAALARERKWKYFELRGKCNLPETAQPAVAFYAHSVNLGGTKTLFSRLAPAVRRAIRKAERSELEAGTETSREAMLEFYGLHVQTRKRHGVPPQPVSFFLNIQEHILAKGLGFISLVRAAGTGVAAAVFLCEGRKGIYKFGASDEAYQKLRPNNLAMWHGMKCLAERGIETLHMGRTSLENEGLRQFKLGWGAEESRMEYFKFDTGTGSWLTGSDRASGIHNAIFSRLPLSVNRIMGRLIYPHLD
jgi:CelD/BcsL family acetyltransferase involved in cellulose biosynthesis